jgi:hypothetical protein
MECVKAVSIGHKMGGKHLIRDGASFSTETKSVTEK